MFKTRLENKNETSFRIPKYINDLILFRCSIFPANSKEVETNTFFAAIPTIEKSALLRMTDPRKEPKKIFTALQKAKFITDFNSKALTILQGPNNDDEKSAIVVCFQAINWIFHERTHEEKDFLDLIKSLRKIYQSEIIHFANLIFYDMLELGLGSQSGISWNEEMIHEVLGYFSTHPSLDSTYFSLALSFFQKVSDFGNKNEEGSMLDLIDQIISLQRPIGNVSDISPLINIIQPYIQYLHPTALSILAHLSESCHTDTLSDILRTVPFFFLSEISSHQSLFKFEAPEKLPEYYEISTKKSINNFDLQNSFKFFNTGIFSNTISIPPKLRASFSSSHISIVAELPKLMTQSTKNLADKAVTFLRGSPAIAETFISSFISYIDGNQNGNEIIELFSFILYVLNELAAPSILNHVLPLISKCYIFTPDQTIFTTIHPKINIFRDFIFQLIARINPKEINGFLLLNKTPSLLLTENISRSFIQYYHILSLSRTSINELASVFINLIYYLFSFAQSNDEKIKNIIAPALQAILSIIFDLAYNPETGYFLFFIQSFSRTFLWLLFETDLTDYVLDIIQMNLSAFPAGDSISQNHFYATNDFPLTTSDIDLSSSLVKEIHLFLQKGIKNPAIVSIALSLFTRINRCIEVNFPLSYTMDIIVQDLIPMLAACPSSPFLHHVLYFILLRINISGAIQLSNKIYNIIAESIKLADNNEPSQQTEIFLWNLLANSSSINCDSIFPIIRPDAISLILYVFGHSVRFPAILSHLMALCEYSDYNKKQCHYGYLDILLLNRLCGKETQKFRNITISFSDSYSFNDLFNLFIPLITLINTYISSSKIVSIFAHTVSFTNQYSYSIQSFNERKNVLKELKNLLYKCQAIPKFSLVLGSREPIMIFNTVKGSDLTFGFTLHFNVRFDSLPNDNIFTQMRIFEIEDSNSQHISIYSEKIDTQHFCIYTCFNSPSIKSIVKIIPNITSCTWNKFTIIFSNGSPTNPPDSPKLPLNITALSADNIPIVSVDLCEVTLSSDIVHVYIGGIYSEDKKAEVINPTYSTSQVDCGVYQTRSYQPIKYYPDPLSASGLIGDLMLFSGALQPDDLLNLMTQSGNEHSLSLVSSSSGQSEPIFTSPVLFDYSVLAYLVQADTSNNLSEDGSENISTCDNSQNQPFFSYKSEHSSKKKSGILKPKKKVVEQKEIEKSFEYEAPLSLIDWFLIYGRLDMICEYFQTRDNLILTDFEKQKIERIYDDIEYTQILFGVLQEVFKRSEIAQMNFKSTEQIYLSLSQHQNLITASIYSSILSVFNVITFKKLRWEWFELLIINPYLWEMGSSQTFIWVLNHWSHLLPIQSQDCLIHKSYFGQLLTQFRLLFSENIDSKTLKSSADIISLVFSKENKYNSDELQHAKRLYLTFLNRIAFVNLTRDDIFILIQCLMGASNSSKTSNEVNLLLDLCHIIAQPLSKVGIPVAQLTKLLSLIISDNMDITLKTIDVIYLFSLIDKDQLEEYMIAIAYALVSHPYVKEVTDSLIEKFEDMPNLLPLLCLLSLHLGPEFTNKIVQKMRSVTQNAISRFDYIGEWYIWPILVAINCEDAGGVCDFISTLLMCGPNIDHSIDKTFLMCSFLKTIYKERVSDIQFELLKTITIRADITNEETVIHILWNVLFSAFFSMDQAAFCPILLNLYRESPFYDPSIYSNFSTTEDDERFSVSNNEIEVFKILTILRQTIKTRGNKSDIYVNIKLNSSGDLMNERMIYCTTSLLGNVEITNELSKQILSLFQYFIDCKQVNDDQLRSVKYSMTEILDTFKDKYKKLIDRYLPLIISNFNISVFQAELDTANSILPLETELTPEAILNREIDRFLTIGFSTNRVNRIEQEQQKTIRKRDRTPCVYFCPFKLKNGFNLITLREQINITPFQKIQNQQLAKSLRSYLTYCDDILCLPAIQISFNKRTNCEFVIVKNTEPYILLITDQTTSKVYPIRDILYAIPKGRMIEFFFQNRPPILIEFIHIESFNDPIPNSNIDPLLKLIRNSPKLISKEEAVSKWQNNHMSTFELICILNQHAGRSFNDPSIYPLFPALLNSISNCHQIFDISIPPIHLTLPLDRLEILNASHQKSPCSLEKVVNDKMYLIPEFFYEPEIVNNDPLPKWAQTKFDFIYQHRVILEQQSTAALLPKWVATAFGGGIQSIPAIFGEPFGERCRMCRALDEGELRLQVQGVQLAAGNFPNLTVVVEDLIVAMQVKTMPFEATPVKSDTMIASPVHSLHAVGRLVFALGNSASDTRIFRIDGGKISGEFRIPRRNDSRLVAFTKSSVFFSPDLCSVARLDFISDAKIRRILVAQAPVIGIAVNEAFKAIAVACADGVVRVYSTVNGKLSAEMDVMGYTEKIIMSSKWGIIVAKTLNCLWVFSINGMLLAKREFTDGVRRWFCFSSNDLDFMVIENDEHKVGCFLLKAPDKIYLFAEVPKGVADVMFDEEHNAFVVLSFDGTLSLIPNPCSTTSST